MLASKARFPVHTFPPAPECLPVDDPGQSRYTLRFARTIEDLRELQRMRFEVFNLELQEGLERSFAEGRDEDRFDTACHHLMVCDSDSERVVGTYRLQTREMARENHGFYSAIEFNMSSLPDEILDLSIEIGRACVARDHRCLKVLYLLWTGLARYMAFNRKRYLFGCSSLSSQNPAEGLAVWSNLQKGGYVHPTFRIVPQVGFECQPSHSISIDAGATVQVPRLMRIYLSLGAHICGPPAIDREFKTIDYFSFFDIQQLDDQAMSFFGYR